MLRNIRSLLLLNFVPNLVFHIVLHPFYFIMSMNYLSLSEMVYESLIGPVVLAILNYRYIFKRQTGSFLISTILMLISGLMGLALHLINLQELSLRGLETQDPENIALLYILVTSMVIVTLISSIAAKVTFVVQKSRADRSTKA